METVVREAAAQLVGYSNVKDLQLQTMVEIANGRGVFSILPTGVWEESLLWLLTLGL